MYNPLRFISLSLMLSITILTVTSQETKPDFAFPAQTAAKSRAEIDRALKTGDGISLLGSLINYSLAQSQISSDNLPESISLIDSIAGIEKDPCTKALLFTLLANIYCDIYTDQKTKFDQRDNNLLPLPDDYNTWDGKQFKLKISALCDSTLQNAEALQATPLQEYRTIITHDNNTFIYYPTLYDFVVRQVITILTSAYPVHNTLPISRLYPHEQYNNTTLSNTPPVTQRILSLYQDLLSFSASQTAAHIICDIDRIKFIEQAVFIPSGNGWSEVRRLTFNLLQDLYAKYHSNEYAAEILISAEQYCGNISQEKWLYNKATSHLSRFPHFTRTNCLKSIISNLSHSSLTLSVPEIVCPGLPFKLKAFGKNVNHADIHIYKLPGSHPLPQGFNSNRNLSSLQLVQTIHLNNDSIVPFSRQDTVTLSLSSPGAYIFVPSISGVTSPQRQYFNSVVCSNLLLHHSFLATDHWATVLNPLTGAPVENAQLYSHSHDKSNTRIAVTGKDGMAKITPGNNFNLFAKKDSCCTTTQRIYARNHETQTIMYGRCLTDLAVYHPGDSVKWCAIAYSIDGQNRQLVTSQRLYATIRDANYQIKDTISLITDQWGRISSGFLIPTDGLSGDYHINIGNERDNAFTSTTFTVSDYKLPSFFVDITDIQIDSPQKGAVTISGKAETFSGFPVADARVTYDISVSQRNIWWRTSTPLSIHTSTSTTDSDGFFSTIIPSDIFASSPIPNGIYTVKVTAMSQTAESRETAKVFTLGAAQFIITSLKRNYNTNDTIMLPVRLVDFNGNDTPGTIGYSILENGDTIHSGMFQSNNPSVNWESVPSGKYDISFRAIADTAATAETVNGICLYHNDDKMPPYETILWVPETDIEIEPGSHTASIPYGTSATNSHIQYTVWSALGVHHRGWLTPKPGNHNLKFAIPDSVAQFTVTMLTVNNFKYEYRDIKFTLKNSKPQIRLNIESFRDKIVPGTTETWKFRVTDNSDNGSNSAMILDMYSKALDQIKKARWNFSFITPQTPQLHYNRYLCSNNSYTITGNSHYILCDDITTPQIDNHGLSFIGRHRHIMFYAKSASTVGQMNMVSESETDSGIVTEEAAVTGDMTNAQPVEEINTIATEHGFSYRSDETPLAFFEPMLTTEDDGKLTFTFTAPNANTTWCLNAIAYNNQLLTDRLSFDIISNKPVMVQPNLPRFLRTGDIAHIKASVMNNTDSISIISTRIEFFDPSDYSVSRHWDYTDTIAPGASAIVTASIAAPTDMPLLGYRIKSSNGEFADGEQSLIPILLSTTPIIDSRPFYIGSDEKQFTTSINTPGDSSRVILQFCENPTWYCVTALPGLLVESHNTSLSAMSAIFSAAIAEGIIRNNPHIASILHQWTQSDKSDSTLVSMLERNQELKTALLNATPWVMNARSDTERMSRLALLFDKEQIKRTYSINIKNLANLQRGKGGWCWHANANEASIWCTLNILNLCGRLSQLGYLPNDKQLNTMIDNAVRFIDEHYAKSFVKNPRYDYSNYTFTRGYFTLIKQSTAAARVSATTVQRLVSEWRDMDIPGKAKAAIILDRNGYHSTSRQILNSLREFSRSTTEKGMWWPSLDDLKSQGIDKIGTASLALDAFHQIEPSSPDVDLIRQWLILQKETGNWGTSTTTSNVIASILNSGTKWHYNAAGAVIKIGDNTISPNRMDKATGYFLSDITSMCHSLTPVSIHKTSSSPSWGAIFYQYTDEMSFVKPASCEAVSIEKRLLREVLTRQGATWEPATEINIGDRIKVELIVKTTRDMDYVAIIDERAACFEPLEQLPLPIYTEGIYFYHENRDNATNFYVTHLPKGTYLLSYELFANNSGSFSSGIASIQSQYAPAMTAHSAGDKIEVK